MYESMINILGALVCFSISTYFTMRATEKKPQKVEVISNVYKLRGNNDKS